MPPRTISSSHGRVPVRALLLSLLSLAVPLWSSARFPGWTSDDLGMLVWLLAVLPAFLLSYHRGWRGASLGLAGAMATLSVSHASAIWLEAPAPPFAVMLASVLVLLAVALGSGWLSERLRQALEDAQRQALMDAGTGLSNRRHADLHLQRAFAAANRGAGLAVVLFDLDHFKSVNDRFGHQAGDEALREFAAILGSNTRAENLSARFGGEEFISVLDGGSERSAQLFADRMRVLLSDVTAERPWGPLTVSAGVAEFEPGMATPEVLVAAADRALYRAKEQGRNCVVALGRAGTVPVGAPRVAAAPAGPEPRGRGETVLVVDDDPAVLRTAVQALKRRGFHAVGAADPERALAIARGLSERIDLLVVDLIMPMMSGFRMVEILADTQQPVRVLYISGHAAADVDWSGVPGGASAFLPKPFTVDALAAAARGVLDAPLKRSAQLVRDAAQDGVLLRERGLLELTAANTVAELELAYGEMLQRLAFATEFRDELTGEHVRRVGWIAGRLAEEYGLPELDVELIERAAPLHDVGKIAVPDSILQKPGPLTDDERELMRRHCLAGAHILGASRHPLIQHAECIAHYHHERWDGTGYPHGLHGEAIPLPARITAVADAYDALTSDRPYRAALSVDHAIEFIMAESGSAYDPQVVATLLRLYGHGRLHELRAADPPPAPSARPAAALTASA